MLDLLQKAPGVIGQAVGVKEQLSGNPIHMEIYHMLDNLEKKYEDSPNKRVLIQVFKEIVKPTQADIIESPLAGQERAQDIDAKLIRGIQGMQELGFRERAGEIKEREAHTAKLTQLEADLETIIQALNENNASTKDELGVMSSGAAQALTKTVVPKTFFHSIAQGLQYILPATLAVPVAGAGVSIAATVVLEAGEAAYIKHLKSQLKGASGRYEVGKDMLLSIQKERYLGMISFLKENQKPGERKISGSLFMVFVDNIQKADSPTQAAEAYNDAKIFIELMKKQPDKLTQDEINCLTRKERTLTSQKKAIVKKIQEIDQDLKEPELKAYQSRIEQYQISAQDAQLILMAQQKILALEKEVKKNKTKKHRLQAESKKPIFNSNPFSFFGLNQSEVKDARKKETQAKEKLKKWTDQLKACKDMILARKSPAISKDQWNELLSLATPHKEDLEQEKRTLTAQLENLSILKFGISQALLGEEISPSSPGSEVSPKSQVESPTLRAAAEHQRKYDSDDEIESYYVAGLRQDAGKSPVKKEEKNLSRKNSPSSPPVAPAAPAAPAGSGHVVSVDTDDEEEESLHGESLSAVAPPPAASASAAAVSKGGSEPVASVDTDTDTDDSEDESADEDEAEENASAPSPRR